MENEKNVLDFIQKNYQEIKFIENIFLNVYSSTYL